MLLALIVVAAAAVVGIATLEHLRRRDRARARDAVACWAVSTRIGVVLAEGLEDPEVHEIALRHLVPSFADWVVLHLVSGDHLRQAALVHADSAIEAELRNDSAALTASLTGPSSVIRTGRSVIARERAAAIGAGSDSTALVRARVGSSVSVPVVARGKVLGALTLVGREPGRYSDDDLPWIQDLGRRIGLSVENRRLFAAARDLFEQTVSANFVSAPTGGLLACNRAFATLLGFESVNQALASDAQTIYANADDRDRFLSELRHSRRIAGRELQLRRRDGGIVVVSMNAVGAFDERGELVQITGFVTDRTAQKELEERLNQIQRLEAVGQLAGGIAHDFNNLLTVIIGCVDLLRLDYTPSKIDPNDPLDELAKAANRAAALTHQLLAFSRRQVLQPRIVDINEAVRTAHSMLSRLVSANITFVLDLNPDVERVRVDPTQLDQVILNLVINAGDAMPDGGTLTISTSNVVLGAADVARHPYVVPGPYVSLKVADTGVGMDETTRARVFEPFFTTKPVGKGTGLGLSTVYGIVKQSGGYVWVTSRLRVGTTVQVCLPPVPQT